jgi:hypothetical protein
VLLALKNGRKFNELAFAGTLAKSCKAFTKQAWDEHVRVLRFWNFGTEEVKKAYRKPLPNKWYK